MKNKFILTLSILLVFSLLLSGCGLLGPAATPTLDPAAQQATVDVVVTQVLQTMAVNLTETAQAMPTSTMTLTPVPPTETFTPQPTATKWVPTATKVPTAKPTATATPWDYNCKILSSSPAAGYKVNINGDFDVTWKVQNIGARTWELGYVDLRYISGTKMQKYADVFDVKSAVATGGDVTMTIDMVAPATAGKYTANWAFMMENITLCSMTVDIEATNP